MSEIALPGADPGDQSAFVGRGLSWPLGVDHTGSIALTSGVPDLDRSIQIVLMTAPGERVMRPEFGCRIWDLLFEPVTATLLGRINEAVRVALLRWEPRVEVEEIDSYPDEENPSLVRIHIRYRVKATNDNRNLVYPFYVIPHDAE